MRHLVDIKSADGLQLVGLKKPETHQNAFITNPFGQAADRQKDGHVTLSLAQECTSIG